MVAGMNSIENEVIKMLKRLEEKWPNSLWIFATGEELNILRTVDGKRVYKDDGSVDESYIVDSVNIPSDGGDW